MVAKLLKDAYRQLQANDPLRMAAATAFFASFALPPIIIILIEILGIFGNSRTIRHGLLHQLSIALDKNIALQVRQILRNIHDLPINPVTRIGGFIFLLFVATTLFEVIRNSMNQLWKIRLKEKPRLAFILAYRARSIGIIMTAGLLFSLVFLLDTTAWLLPDLANRILYHVVTITAGTAWFTLILRYQSYGRPHWRTAMTGGVFTGLLFAVGEILLHLLLSYNNIQTIYGASTSLVFLLLFIFYSSLIFYFGACFTAALADRTNRPIRPIRHAVRYT
jgi:membrane protein